MCSNKPYPYLRGQGPELLAKGCKLYVKDKEELSNEKCRNKDQREGNNKRQRERERENGIMNH